MSGIGLLSEKPLHASLKQWYARLGNRFEVPVDGFVIDIVRDDLLIEIQTRKTTQRYVRATETNKREAVQAAMLNSRGRNLATRVNAITQNHAVA